MLFVSQKPGDLVFLTVKPDPSIDFQESVEKAYHCLGEFLETHQSILLQERVYAPVSVTNRIDAVRAEILNAYGDAADIPVTYVEGKPIESMAWSGIHAMAITQNDIEDTSLLKENDNVCGRLIKGREAQHLFLSDISRLIDPSYRNCPEEAFYTLKKTDEILKGINWNYFDVKRTWFYLDDILGWYDEFNKARNDVYHSIGLFNGRVDGIIPASTGIEGKNPRGGCCTLDILAMRPIDQRPFNVQRLVNPKQNEAPEYGSAFSRGLSVRLQKSNYLFVSGTASIDEYGKSVFFDDAEQQVRRTLENIAALMESEGGGLKDISQATAFVKRAEDLPIFFDVAEEMGLPKDIALCMVADVCRDELLFELDASAVLPV